MLERELKWQLLGIERISNVGQVIVMPECGGRVRENLKNKEHSVCQNYGLTYGQTSRYTPYFTTLSQAQKRLENGIPCVNLEKTEDLEILGLSGFSSESGEEDNPGGLSAGFSIIPGGHSALEHQFPPGQAPSDW